MNAAALSEKGSLHTACWDTLHVEAAAEFGGQVDLLTSGNGADGS